MAIHKMKSYKIEVIGENHVIEKLEQLLVLSKLMGYNVIENKYYDYLDEPLFLTYEFMKGNKYQFTLFLAITHSKNTKKSLVKKTVTLRQTTNILKGIKFAWFEEDENTDFKECYMSSSAGKTYVIEHIMERLQ